MLATVMATLVLVFLLTLSMSSLAVTSLRVAENRRDRVVAEQAAEAGLTLAMARIRAAEEPPDELSGNCGDGVNCSYQAVLKEENDTGALYEVSVKGYGQNGAERELAALVLKGHGEPRIAPVFSQGLVSKDTVLVTGSPTIVGDVHGDDGFDLRGNRIQIEEGVASASCTPEKDSDCTCSVHGASLREYCQRDGTPTYVVPPAQVDDPAAYIDTLWERYDEPRPGAGFDVVHEGRLEIHSTSDLEELGIGNGDEPVRIRVVDGNVNIGPGVEIENVEFVLDDDRTFSSEGDLTQVKVWAGNISIQGAPTLNKVALFADQRVEIGGGTSVYDSVIMADSLGGDIAGNNPDTNGNVAFYSTKVLVNGDYTVSGHVEFYGASTVVSRGDLEFRGHTLFDVSTYPDGSPGLALIAEGDVTIHGAGGREDLAGVIWSGGQVIFNDGASTLYGGVVALGQIIKHGNTNIYARYIENDDLPTVDSFDGVQVLSRTVLFGD